MKDIITFFKKAREEPKQKKILKEVQKASFNAMQHQQHKEENFTIVKSFNFNIFSPKTLVLKLPDAMDVKIYISLLLYFYSSNSMLSNPLCPTINKD